MKDSVEDRVGYRRLVNTTCYMAWGFRISSHEVKASLRKVSNGVPKSIFWRI
jgi:hypothetical protein